jgi:UDP-N-acetylmuramoyl-L-alanyl-D-glutamate--2,6-diaminopimelate ligase
LESLNLNDLKSKDINYSKIVNHTLDVTDDSILCINHNEKEKLDEYIRLSLKQNPKFIITSSNSEIENEKVLKFEHYDAVFNHILHEISPNFNDLDYFGITGTNGKTTTAFYLNQLIGEENLFVGTIDEKEKYFFTNEKILTTPKLFNIVKLISLQKNKIKSVSLEVSSHALDQNRLGNLEFLISGFTNLSQDHLDYHGSLRNYLHTKAKLFQKGVSEKFVYIDSEDTNDLLEASNIDSYSIGSKQNSNVRLIKFNDDSLEFIIDGNKVECELNLTGPKYIENFLLAFSMAYYSGLFSLNDLISNSGKLTNPPGRFETITHDNKTVVVDYAHTPVAINETINHAKGKYISVKVILGAGGDRDKSKRTKMGEAAANADYIIITNDNPRSEDPVQISKNILNGIPLNKNTEVILDRKEAIYKGVESLKDNEVLLILGKGHEKVQEIQNKFSSFDDVKIAKEALELRS